MRSGMPRHLPIADSRINRTPPFGLEAYPKGRREASRLGRLGVANRAIKFKTLCIEKY
jgi:hypothetical protein